MLAFPTLSGDGRFCLLACEGGREVDSNAISARTIRSIGRLLMARPSVQIACNADIPGFSSIRILPANPNAMHLISAEDDSWGPSSVVDEPVSLGATSLDGAAMLQIERFWREGGGCYLQGWFHAYDAAIVSAVFVQDEGERHLVTEFHPREDLLPHYPTIPEKAARAGFSVHLPEQAGSRLRLLLSTHSGAHRVQLRLPAAEPPDAGSSQNAGQADSAFERFRSEVNERGLDVLEIGSRTVGMVSTDLRALFPGAGRYVGMDVHPAPGVDLVGDAHELSRLTGTGTFDAIHSLAVMEHLAMPWVAAVEMNRVLRLGGLVFHRTHQTWPLHERPNDFWRFTDESLRLLFGKTNGFEVLSVGLDFPLTIYPKRKGSVFNQLPLNPGFGVAFVLARKVGDAIDTQEDEMRRRLGQRYPGPASTTLPAGGGSEAPVATPRER